MLASSAAKQALTYMQQKEHVGIATTMRSETPRTWDIKKCRATRRAAKCSPNTT